MRSMVEGRPVEEAVIRRSTAKAAPGHPSTTFGGLSMGRQNQVTAPS
jgi:hypothetical protein